MERKGRGGERKDMHPEAKPKVGATGRNGDVEIGSSACMKRCLL